MMINVMITTAGKENGGEAGRRRRRRRRWKAGMGGGGGGGNGRGRSRMMDALSERRTNEKRNDINDVHTHSAKRGDGECTSRIQNNRKYSNRCKYSSLLESANTGKMDANPNAKKHFMTY